MNILSKSSNTQANRARKLIGKLKKAVVNCDAEEAERVAKEALKAGLDPLEAIEKGLARGIRIVGKRFEMKKAFLPELMLAAVTMKAALSVLEPALAKRKKSKNKGTVLLGTVEGDIHDIGKNIVGAMLRANGFEVHDIGVDVPPEKFVEKVKEVKPDIVGISALLTTTMPKMVEVIEALKKAGLRDKVKVLVGGAPVRKEWAQQIGADAYATDAVEAVRVSKKLLSDRLQATF